MVKGWNFMTKLILHVHHGPSSDDHKDRNDSYVLLLRNYGSQTL